MGLTNNCLETVRISAAKQTPESPSAPVGIDMERVSGIDLPGHRTGVRCLAVAHDDSLVMSTSAEAVKIWSASTGRCVRTMASGYGLCGFFVAGNEHVVIGTKEVIWSCMTFAWQSLR